MTNMTAAKAVADMIRTSLGPKGMDKMITTSSGEVIITNDGATILKKINVNHPAAQMLVDLSAAQDVEAGDGTTSVVVIAGALIKAAMNLLAKGIHPSSISEAFMVAQREASEILKTIAIPIDLTDKKSLVLAASTSLNSKVISNQSDFLAPLAVDAVMHICKDSNAENVDLDDIKVVKKLGGVIEDTELVDGIVLDNGVSHSAGGGTIVNGCKIGLIQYCLSAPKTNMENSVVVSDYAQIDRNLREEKKYIVDLLKPIVKSGCNVLLIQKSILRDAVNEQSLTLLAKKKIMVIKDVERSDVEFIASTLGCTPVADPDAFSADKLGQAELAEEVSTMGGNCVKITGVKNQGKTVSVLVRGSNRLLIDEAHRSVHDALCVVRSLVKLKYLIPGGGAPETEVSIQLAKYANTVGGTVGYCVKEFARALEVVPYTLAENAGLNPIKIVTELRNRHVKGEKFAGINVRKGGITEIGRAHV